MPTAMNVRVTVAFADGATHSEVITLTDEENLNFLQQDRVLAKRMSRRLAALRKRYPRARISWRAEMRAAR